MISYAAAFALAVLISFISKMTVPRLPSHRQLPDPSSTERKRRTDEESWEVTKVRNPPRNLHDVCEVIFLLRQVTISDLIPEILDLGEYWTVTSAARASRRTSFSQSNAGRAYVIATVPDYLPVGSVRKIKFSTVSRDQGWSSFREDQNTYRNSHTWFEAVVYEPDPYELAKIVIPGRRIITNVHAGTEWKKHDVVWAHDSDDEQIRDLLTSIKGGQRVAITAWAMFPGWVNNVSSASIDIYTPRVRRG